MERNPAIDQLIALARRIGETVGLRPEADVTLEDIEPLIQVCNLVSLMKVHLSESDVASTCTLNGPITGRRWTAASY